MIAEDLIQWWFINGLSKFYSVADQKKIRLMKGMAAKNITYNNVTYDEAFFADWNYTSNNLNASRKAMERVEKI
jgi:hypothetical protein